ncbi:D-alanyl-D-alanine carboxypeptidase family protein [Dethiothermospora halolimnae]|uniref:D-alanyl-D-alanine carboxypeptidase family protein n=1 Tax=Dethiothermospora halolimnae TaxID=3114390 RepID=UPI003CCBF6AD
MRKKIVSITLVITLLLAFITSFSYAEEAFDVKAKSAILIDAESGEIIYEKNINEKLPPASITKIMLLLLTMESLDENRITLQDEVVVSENAAGMGGSQVYLEEGETQKVEHLIRAISLRSANDCAVALGEYIAGSEELFVKMMNTRAKELGMNNTNFMNITGLPHENHYTTAYDISLMAKELLKHPKIHNWLTLWMSSIKVGKEKDVTQQLTNTNRLINKYKGINGLKTGYTSKAGHCLAASAKRGNLKLISVVLGSETSTIRFNETKKLLDYGFANYDSLQIAKKGSIIRKMDVDKGEIEQVNIVIEKNLSLLLKKGQSKNIDKKIILPDKLQAPLEKNAKVGEIIYSIDGKEMGRTSLLTDREVNKASVFFIFKKIFKKYVIN